MLEVRFYNVGDGDAILLKETRPGQPDYNVLVDTGRPFVELGAGSKRRDIVTHLLQDGIDHIDFMILTHLHIDHIGGAMDVLRNIPVYVLCADYFPPEDAARIPLPEETEVKSAVGLRYLLNIYQNLWQEARKYGTMTFEAREGIQLLTSRLQVTFLPAPEAARTAQNALFDALYRGGQPAPEEEIGRLAKGRNPNGLATIFSYARRRVLLSADVYAPELEARLKAAPQADTLPAETGDRAEAAPATLPDGKAASLPCDIVKLPHHGDEKSATRSLLEALRPSWAVISCQTDPPKKKRRPAEETVALLQALDIPFACTENRALPGLEAASHRVLAFVIKEDGTIVPPVL